MNNKVLYKVFIWAFVLLYSGTAFISYCHSIEFFNIGNAQWMSYILGAIFEIGQAVVLASLLLTNNKKTLLPWLLMILLTLVQVVGNTFSVFKFMSLSENNYYIYLSKPLLFWIDGISQETVMIIISWIVGAMLPIVALAMTSMVTNQMKLQENGEVESKISTKTEEIEEDKLKESKIIEEDKKESKKEENDIPIKESKHRIKSVEDKKNSTRHN